MANTDYGAVLLTACEATSQALNHRLGVSTGFKPSEWADNINLLVKPAEKSASGSVAHFTDGLDMPLVSLSCDVTAWQEGTGTASPSNPRPIHGWSEANVYRAGKNLFDKRNYSFTGRGLTISKNNDKIRVSGVYNSTNASYAFSANATSANSGNYANYVLYQKTDASPIKAGTYTVTLKSSVNFSFTFYVGSEYGYSYGNGSDTSHWLFVKPQTQTSNEYTFTFTINEDSNYGFVIGHNAFAQDTRYDFEISCQIEVGETATAYEAYHSTSLNIPFGQTVYGGRLNVMTGELTITHAIIDMGSLSWIYNSSANVFWAVISDMKRPCTLLCEKYTQSSATNVENMADYEIWNRGYAYNDKNIVAKDTNYATADAFKTAVTGVRLVYELATSTTITLTPHQMSSLLGENNIWADCGDSAVVYRGMVGDSFKCFFNSQVTSGWTATSAERTMLTITAKGNGSITFGNKGTGRTNCGSNDGYIVIRKNGTDAWKKTLTSNTDIACNDIPKIDFVAGDVITLTFGFTNYHSNINIKLVGDSFTIIGSTQISGISNTTNTTTTIEIAT